MAGSYIVAGARTPIGKMSGALAGFSAAELGGFAIKEALVRAGVSPDEVEHVLMGQVLMAGQGQVPSRQAAFKAEGRFGCAHQAGIRHLTKASVSRCDGIPRAVRARRRQRRPTRARLERRHDLDRP